MAPAGETESWRPLSFPSTIERMRFHLLHAGTLVGTAELEAQRAPSREPDEPWRPPVAAEVTLVGTLTPTAAYDALRPLLQRLVQAAAAAAPSEGAPAPGLASRLTAMTDALQLLWQVATLPLALTRADGTAVTTERLLVLDAGAADTAAIGPVLTAVLSGAEASRLEAAG